MARLTGVVAAVAAFLWVGHASAVTTNFVSSIQTYACASHTWANSLAGSTAATTCTQPSVGDLNTVAAGTVLGNITGSTAAPTASSAPVLGVASTTAGTLGLFNSATANAITIQNGGGTANGATSAYNFNLPITVGTAGQVLTSQAGGTTAMTWSTVATAALTVTTNPASPVTLATANDRTLYQVTNSTAVTFNLTASLTAGDNWCFSMAGSTGAITVADNSVTSAQIIMANVSGTATTGTLVGQGLGSTACLFISVGGANPIAVVYSSEGAWNLT